MPEPRAKEGEIVPEIAQTVRQWSLLRQWIDGLRDLPAVEVVWLEGSLARGQGNPSSDIDIRFGIADAEYENLWKKDRTPLLMGLGSYLLLETRFVRALTSDGIIVEATAYPSSELEGLELYEWEILFNRLPADHLNFKRLPERSPAEVWPVYDELTVDVVRGLTNMHLLLMASGAAPLYNGELHSARFQLDDLRTELIQIMYRRLGLTYAKRFKHFSEIFPTAWLIDLDKTYMSPGASPLDVSAMAEAYINLFAVIGKHLQALSDKAGGGFEPIWYFNLANLVEEQFRHFIPPSTIQ